MKRGTESKVKFKKLERALRLETWQVKGLLQSIWDFAVVNAPAGDIGRYSDDEIAIGIGYSGDIGPLLRAMVDTEWIDDHPAHRLIIHHWAEHCEESIHAQLARRRMLFADGSIPKLTKLQKGERQSTERALKKLADDQRQTAADSGSQKPPECAGGGIRHPTLTCALPKPAPKPLPKPARQVAGVFESLTEADLADNAKLTDWFDRASGRRKPVIENTDTNRLHVFAAAERAIEEGNEPVGLFAWIVAGEKWDYITQSQEDKARLRLAEVRRQRDGPEANGGVVGVKLKTVTTKPRDDF